MSLTKTIVDAASRQLLTIKRRSMTTDLDGDPTASDVTIATAFGDLQPVSAEVRETASASVSGIAGTSNVTHISFLETRLTGTNAPKEKDLVVDEGGVEYSIIFVHDFRGAPQELDLRLN